MARRIARFVTTFAVVALAGAVPAAAASAVEPVHTSNGGTTVQRTARVTVDAGGATGNLGAGPSPAIAGAPTSGDVSVAVGPCGVHVVVIGRSDGRCSTSGGNQNGGATGSIPHAIGAPAAAPGRADRPTRGSGGNAPLTGLGLSSFLVSAGGLVATGAVARRVRSTPAFD